MFASIFVSVMTLFHFGHGNTIHEANKLLKDKFDNYNLNLRPVLNQSATVNLRVALSLISLKEFDEVNGKMSISGVLSMFWIDENMKWDPRDYGGIDEFSIQDTNTVWKPTFVLLNNADKLETVKGGGFVMQVASSGLVQWSFGSMFSATCHVDITFYPWDTQECTFEFASWGYYPHHVTIQSHSDGVAKSNYIPNGVWDLVDSGSSIFLNVILKYTLKFKRMPVFIFLNVILPIIFLSFLNLITFLIPAESGERLSYCITVLLSISVFLTIVGDNLPKTSNPMSILSYYLICVLGMSVCITLANIFSLRIYFRDEREHISELWRGLVCVFRCKCARSNRRRTTCETYYANEQFSRPGYRYCHGNTLTDISDINSEGNIDLTANAQLPRRIDVYKEENNILKKKICDDMAPRAVYPRSSTCKPPADGPGISPPTIAEISWKDASAAVDALCFVLFLIIYISFSLWCGLKITTNV